MRHRVFIFGLLAAPYACSQNVLSTVRKQDGDSTVCSFLKSFDVNCLEPVLGTYGTLEVKTNMEGACEVMFWGLPAKDLPEVSKSIIVVACVSV